MLHHFKETKINEIFNIGLPPPLTFTIYFYHRIKKAFYPKMAQREKRPRGKKWPRTYNNH